MEILKNDALLQRMIRQYHIDHFFTDFDAYAQGFRLISFPKRTFLYSRPEHRKYAYFLVSGSLRVYATGAGGQQMLVRRCDSFIFLGDMELFGYEEPSNMVETTTACMFVAFDIVLLGERLLEDKRFLRFLGASLAEKMNYFARNQFHRQTISGHQKVISYVLKIGGEHGYFRKNLRQTAEVLGISYRHLHRILGELVEAGVLMRSERGYEIKEIRRLEELYWEYEK